MWFAPVWCCVLENWCLNYFTPKLRSPQRTSAAAQVLPSMSFCLISSPSQRLHVFFIFASNVGLVYLSESFGRHQRSAKPGFWAIFCSFSLITFAGCHFIPSLWWYIRGGHRARRARAEHAQSGRHGVKRPNTHENGCLFHVFGKVNGLPPLF